MSVDAQILAILEKSLTEWQEVLRRSVQAIVQPKAENQGETRKKQRCKNENIRNLARRFCIRFRACCGVARSALGVVVSGDLVESLGTAYEDRPLPVRREEFVSLPGGRSVGVPGGNRAEILSRVQFVQRIIFRSLTLEVKLAHKSQPYTRELATKENYLIIVFSEHNLANITLGRL